MSHDSDEHRLHERALVERDDVEALRLWVELAARGNPDAPERLRGYVRCDDPQLRGPARQALEDLGLSHDEPMP